MADDNRTDRPQTPIIEERSLGGISALRPAGNQVQSNTNTTQAQTTTAQNTQE
jgi:hypothetical protein